MIRLNEATFTKKIRSREYPYLFVSLPSDVVQLLELKKGDFVEIHLKVIKRVEHG